MLGWKGAPSAQGILITTETETEVRFNSVGLRDGEYDLTKPTGVTRIAVLGDSFVWGYGVEQYENFTAVLEARLDEAGYPSEVINFGLTGYGTDQNYLAYLELARAYGPDIVLLAFYENDVLEVANDRMYGYPKPYFELDADGQLILTNQPVPEPPNWIAAREFGASALGVPGTFKNRLYSNLATIHVVRFAIGKGRLLLEGNDAYTKNSDAWPKTRALIAALDDAVTADGGQLVVLLIPTRFEMLRTAPWAFELGDVIATLADERRDAAVVDLRPALSHPDEGTPADLYFEYSGYHWTAAGHAVVADALYHFLLDEGLIP